MIVEAYWRCAVSRSGLLLHGRADQWGVLDPAPAALARLGDKTQEHCTVYHMMRLADYLLRWTGDASYDDYWERNLYNGSLAQQHPETGMVTYFLPLRSGSTKKWGTPTDDFWCCHGTLIQAHTGLPEPHLLRRRERPRSLTVHPLPARLGEKWGGVSSHCQKTRTRRPSPTSQPLL